MKRFLLLALVVACSSSSETKPAPAAPAAVPRTAPSTPPPALLVATAVVVPGRSIGPYALGMSRRDIIAAGGPVSEPTKGVLVTGPYELVLDGNDQLQAIARRLSTNVDGTPVTEPVQLGSTVIEPSTAFDELRRIVPGCGEVEHADGGTTARCADQVEVQAAGPPGLVRIAVATSR